MMIPEGSVVSSTSPVAKARTVRAQNPAGATLRHSPPLLSVDPSGQVTHGLSPSGGPQKFFDRRSLSASTSCACSATRRFSRRFSSSRARSRRASFTARPPYFRFQRYSVSVLTPRRRHSSPVGVPASCSLRAAMVCSSLNLLLRMMPSFRLF